MACKYRLGKNKNVKSTGYNKYYARTHTGGLVSNEELAKRMAARNTTYSEGEMRGLIIDLTALIRELAYEGRSVKIDNLGIFWVGCCSKGVANPSDFNASTDISSRWKCRPTGDGKSKAIEVTRAGGVAITWEEDTDYNSPRTPDEP